MTHLMDAIGDGSRKSTQSLTEGGAHHSTHMKGGKDRRHLTKAQMDLFDDNHRLHTR